MSVETITDQGKEEYEEILLQIDNEHEKQQSLKAELKKINTKINANHLATKNNNKTIKTQLFYATVKIFDNLIDLIEFYGHDVRKEIDNLLEKDKDFYAIDLKISQLLQNHILTKKWLFNICISNDNSGLAVNKSINFKNNISNRILSVTAMDKCIAKMIVNVSLVWPCLNYWPILKLQPIEVDISYHFRTYNQETFIEREEHLSNVNTFFQPQDKSKEHSYKIVTNFSKQKLLEVILENSYHRLDILNCVDAKVRKLQFIVEDTSLIKLEFDSDSKELKLQANSYLLKLLKEFFYKKNWEAQNEGGEIKVAQKDKPLDTYKRDLETGLLDLDQLKNIYDSLRN